MNTVYSIYCKYRLRIAMLFLLLMLGSAKVYSHAMEVPEGNCEYTKIILIMEDEAGKKEVFNENVSYGETVTVSDYVTVPNGQRLKDMDFTILTADGESISDETYDGDQDFEKCVRADGEQKIECTFIFEKQTYTLRFNMNRGMGNQIDEQIIQFEKEWMVPACLAQRTGFTFDCWNTKEDGTGVDIRGVVYPLSWDIAKEADDNQIIRLYAKWKPDVHTLYFSIPEDAVFKEGTGSMQVTYGQTLGKLPVPERKYYNFIGWLQENGSVVTEKTVSKYLEDTELHAKWELKDITISFQENGGQFAAGESTTRVMKAKSSLGTMPVVVRKGYKLEGWYRINEGNKQTITADTILGADLTLYPQWTEVKKPAAVKKLTVKKTGGTKKKITFQKVKNADGYLIQYATKSNFKNVKTVDTTKTSVTLTKLKKGKKYYIRVCAYQTDSAGIKYKGKWRKK